jgi:hypothetical protein
MNKNPEKTAEAYARLDELMRIGSVAVQEAIEESRRMGVPNVYEFNGRVYYELPNGELSLEDPYVEPNSSAK